MVERKRFKQKYNRRIPKDQDKRQSNGRPKGAQNAIPKAFKEQILQAMEVIGSDGRGTGGTEGYFRRLLHCDPDVQKEYEKLYDKKNKTPAEWARLEKLEFRRDTQVEAGIGRGGRFIDKSIPVQINNTGNQPVQVFTIPAPVLRRMSNEQLGVMEDILPLIAGEEPPQAEPEGDASAFAKDIGKDVTIVK